MEYWSDWHADHKVSNNKTFRYIVVVIDNFSKHTWCIPLKNKISQTKKEKFSKNLTSSKRKPIKKESNRGNEFYISIFQEVLKMNNFHHYSRYTHKGPSIVEGVIRTIHNLSKKQVFQSTNSSWLSDLPSVVKKYNNTNHHSTKMTPIEVSKKVIEIPVFPISQTKSINIYQNTN